MKKIFIDKHYYPHITKMLDSFDKKERLPLLTFIIDQAANHICLIGRKSGEPTMVKLPFDGQDPTLQDGTWSIDADMFKYYYQNCLKSVLENEHIELEIDEHASGDTYVIGYTHDQGVRRWKCDSPCQEHLDYFTTIGNKSYQSISVDALAPILNVADSHRPLEFFKIDKTKNEITVQRDNDVSTFPLPDDLEEKVDLVANQEGLSVLKHVCGNTQSDLIMFNIDNEQLTVTDGQHCYSHSLASLTEFENKSKVDYETEVKCVVDISSLKSEIETYTRVNQIKSNNLSLLYIIDNEAFLSGFGFTVESFKSLSALSISAKESFLYNVNLKQLNAIKIRDITSMKGMILRILKAPDGSRKLGLYNEHDTQLPYNSIPIILDTNSHNLKAMQNLLPLDKKIEKTVSNNQTLSALTIFKLFKEDDWTNNQYRLRLDMHSNSLLSQFGS
ncbi:hypothetical protein [Photobacterium leiognathi]|uniref:hypothetical protein n=1 Tax=Photobacterium leiognathi TaxID=553611 RepID=UPI002982AE8A|nr:hypothetical protein [Photobacterium leiognathi]